MCPKKRLRVPQGLAEKCPDSKVGGMAFANAVRKGYGAVQGGREQASGLSSLQVKFLL